MNTPDEAVVAVRNTQRWIQSLPFQGHKFTCAAVDVPPMPIRHERCNCGRNEVLSGLGMADEVICERA